MVNTRINPKQEYLAPGTFGQKNRDSDRRIGISGYIGPYLPLIGNDPCPADTTFSNNRTDRWHSSSLGKALETVDTHLNSNLITRKNHRKGEYRGFMPVQFKRKSKDCGSFYFIKLNGEERKNVQ
jgi:hypothetical protein